MTFPNAANPCPAGIGLWWGSQSRWTRVCCIWKGHTGDGRGTRNSTAKGRKSIPVESGCDQDRGKEVRTTFLSSFCIDVHPLLGCWALQIPYRRLIHARSLPEG